MVTVLLVRHGESQSNAGLATPDPVKVALTSLGHKQAKQVATFLKEYTPLNLIVTSPYLRTKQTAGPTRQLFLTAAVEEWEVQEFTYLSSMHQEQSTTEDRKPLVEIYWSMCEPSFTDSSYPYSILNPHAESFKVFIWRVQAFIRRLRELDNKCQNIAVFSHEQFIAAALWWIERRPTQITPDTMRDFRHFFKQNRLPNGGIVELKVRRSHDEWRYELITEHLKRAVSGPEPPRIEERELASAR
jgi:broad specificity phosphatase PhoE